MKYIKTFEEINWSKLNPKKWRNSRTSTTIEKFKEIKDYLYDISDISDFHRDDLLDNFLLIAVFKIKLIKFMDSNIDEYLLEIKDRVNTLDKNISTQLIMDDDILILMFKLGKITSNDISSKNIRSVIRSLELEEEEETECDKNCSGCPIKCDPKNGVTWDDINKRVLEFKKLFNS